MGNACMTGVIFRSSSRLYASSISISYSIIGLLKILDSTMKLFDDYRIEHLEYKLATDSLPSHMTITSNMV